MKNVEPHVAVTPSSASVGRTRMARLFTRQTLGGGCAVGLGLSAGA